MSKTEENLPTYEEVLEKDKKKEENRILKLGIEWYEGKKQAHTVPTRQREKQLENALELFNSIPKNGEANYYLYLIYSDDMELPLENLTNNQRIFLWNKHLEDNPKAFKYLTKSAKLDYIFGKMQLAYCYQQGLFGIEINPDKAIELYKTCEDDSHSFYELYVLFSSCKDKELSEYYLNEGLKRNNYMCNYMMHCRYYNGCHGWKEIDKNKSKIYIKKMDLNAIDYLSVAELKSNNRDYYYGILRNGIYDRLAGMSSSIHERQEWLIKRYDNTPKIEEGQFVDKKGIAKKYSLNYSKGRNGFPVDEKTSEYWKRKV
jgi:hypothetical protein